MRQRDGSMTRCTVVVSGSEVAGLCGHGRHGEHPNTRRAGQTTALRNVTGSLGRESDQEESRRTERRDEEADR